MGDYFHGWKRKLGCVTLVIALVFMGLWVRSLGVGDVIDLPVGRYTAQCFSCWGRLDFGLRFHGDRDEFRSAGSWKADHFSEIEVFFLRCNFIKDFNGYGVPVGEPLHLHYSYITIPLVLISAISLLAGHRKSRPR